MFSGRIDDYKKNGSYNIYAKNAAQPVSQEVCPPYGGTDFLSAGSRKKKKTIFSRTNLNPARSAGFCTFTKLGLPRLANFFVAEPLCRPYRNSL